MNLFKKKSNMAGITGNAKDVNESIIFSHPKYSLDYIMQIVNAERESSYPLYYGTSQILAIARGEDIDEPRGEISVFHDVSIKKWRISFQLEPDRYWFLSVFFHETGEFDMFCLDYEAADDSHYEFIDEELVRKRIRKPRDDHRYLHEIFIRYIREKGGGIKGGFELLRKIPVIQAFHY